MRFLRPLLPALAALALLAAALLPARAQDEAAAASYVPRDDEVDARLRQARELAARRRFADVAKAFILAEDRIAARRREDPSARPVVAREGARDVFVGVETYIREEIAKLPPEVLDAYRAARDPRAEELLARAADDPADPAPLEEIALRYPLTTRAPEALTRLADLRIERGELEDAIFTLRELESILVSRRGAGAGAAELDAVAARSAFVRERLATAAREAGAVWPMEGGAPDRAAEAAAAPLPGATRYTVALPAPEVSPAVREGFARLGLPAPLVSRPVATGGLILVADSKTVVALGEDDGKLRWIYGANDPADDRPDPAPAPERVDNLACSVAVGGGRVYATLDRNTAPIFEGDKVRRAADWRIVALEAKSGRLLWDAAAAGGPVLDAIARDARYVTPPLVAGGRVYAGVTSGAGNLQAHVIALDARTGALLWRTFVGSASPDDFRAIGCQGAPPASAGGLVFYQSNLGTLVALDARDGAIRWEARYRPTPASSQKRIIRDGLRFSLSAPRVVDGTVAIAPQDAGAALGFDAASGARRWRFERDDLTGIIGVSRGRLILAGKRTVIALDPGTGRVGWEVALSGGPILGQGFATASRVYVPLAGSIAMLGAEEGQREGDFALPPGAAGSGGNLLVTPRGVYILGPDALTALAERAPSLAEAKQAAALRPQDPAALFAYGSLLARAEPASLDTALDLLERAAEVAGRPDPGEPGLAAKALAQAFAAAQAAADAALRADDPEAYFRYAARAVRVSAPGPQSLALLRSYAERALAAGRGAEAVEAYYRIVRDDRDVPAAVAPGIEAPAGEWARRRLVELRAKLGSGPFSQADARAAKAYEVAQRAGTPEALERVIEENPATPCESDALLSLALFYERRDLANQAARCYALHAARYPEAREAPAVLYKLAGIYERTKRGEDARRVLEAIRDRFGKQTLEVGGGARVDLGRFAADRLACYAAMRPLPSLPVGAPEEMRLSFQTWTDLDDEEPALITPRGLEADRSPVFLVAEQEAIEARLVDTGSRIWRRRPGPGFQRARTGLAGKALVLSTPREIEAVDFDGGSPLWRWPAAALLAAPPGAGAPVDAPPFPAGHDHAEPATETGDAAPIPPLPPGGDGEREDPLAGVPDPDAPLPPRPTPDGGSPLPPANPPARLAPADPEPVRGVLVTRDRVVVAFRHAVVALEAAGGKVLWRAEREETLAGDPIEVPGGARGRAVVYSEVPARLVALDIESGAEAYALSIGEHEARMTVRPVAAGPGRLFCVTGGGEVFAIDGAGGAVIWRRMLPYWPRELRASPDGRALCVLPYGVGADQPRLAILDGASGISVFEDRREKSRVSQVVFDGDMAYVFSGDFVAARLRALDWRTGAEKWVWVPQRGQAFGEIGLARDHLVLPQTGPTGEPIVYVLDRERGTIYKAFRIEGRRVISAAVQDGSLLVSTNRGLLGYTRLDAEKLRAEQAEIADAAAARPGDASLRVMLADRRFKQGDFDGAAATLEVALEEEGLTVAAYDLLYRQLLGVLEAAPVDARMEVGRLSHPPEIDGDLHDWWPLQQSVRLEGPRYVSPIQGYEQLGVWRGDDDLAGTLYLGWDAQNFYFALDIEDSALVPYDSESKTWKGDCLLIALDTLGNEGDVFQRDDNLLSLALTLPKKNKQPDEQGDEQPEGKFFVKRKDDGSGAVYEAAIPWKSFNDKGAQFDLATGPKPGTTFGFNIVVTDDDDGRGARKQLSWTHSLALHREKEKLWSGFVPRRFAKIILK